MNDMKYLVKVSQFVNKTFALWVIIFGILGFIFPEIFKLVGPYVPVLLGVVMFGMGLTLSTADFREVVRRPKEVLTGVVAQFTIMPISAYALCVLLNLPADVAVGMMLLGCAPGGTASNVVTFIARRCGAFRDGDVLHDAARADRNAGLDVRFCQSVACQRSGFDVPFDRPDDPAPDRRRRRHP